MIKFYKFSLFFLGLILQLTNAKASVVTEYAINNYQKKEYSQAEQKCLDEGYKITYANCSNNTAPTERCPYHHNYYRSCSQEQWCRNNNFSFFKEDCKSPFYPYKMCINNFPLYRVCQEDIEKSCLEEGYFHKDTCQLTDKKCPFSPDYGICCDNCPNHTHLIDSIPEGYVVNGDICTTCDGIIKTKIKPNDCEGYLDCEYGPFNEDTSYCLQGDKKLYTECKTTKEVCFENGYNKTSCGQNDDSIPCPQNNNYVRCKVNCLKTAIADNPASDIIAEDAIDPILDITKTELKSLVFYNTEECKNYKRPEITLHINHENIKMYENVFDRYIENININLIYEDPIVLSANGILKNVKIKASGNYPECPLMAREIKISGTVSFSGFTEICANIEIDNNSKFISTGGLKGDVKMLKNASLGLKGNLLGHLESGSNSEILIKGKLEYNAKEKSQKNIVFGCNSKVRIENGIVAETASLYLKQWTHVDTPSIRLISTTNNAELKDSLSAVHMYKLAKIFNSYGDTVYPLSENNDQDCDDKYYIHLGSALDELSQTYVLEPSNIINDWKCQSLSIKAQECD